ncbi:TonB system transport protein ExbD [Paracoccus jeotgali]|uniref:Biopolymer transport protein ExbD n=1 Tax=Paracoccus jeotgali TaxID=2065379 RepID=A0A2K9MKV7_9RHOB|nr:TonB system transport protein ExbD [Paracoccus jeotgali]AUM75245.1 TonB system transport protein ExbD [Paracoccus jeotgali]
MMGGPEDDELTEQHEINVTPFIDVMLVLLIIFMVAAPLATVDLNVDLPAARGAASPRPEQPLYVTIAADGGISIGDQAVAEAALIAALEAATGGDRQARLFLRGDRSISYGQVMGVMSRMRDAGWTRIALVGLDQGAAP